MTVLALQPGELFGRAARSLHLPSATLTESVYAPGERLPDHSHPTEILCLVVSGSFDEVVERVDRFCRVGQLLYRPAGESHSQRFLRAGAQCFTLELGGVADDDALPPRPRRRPAQVRGSEVMLAARLFDAFRRPPPADTLFVEGLSDELWARVYGAVSTTEAREPRWLADVREWMHDRYADSITIAQLARRVGVHRVHLSRTFRRFTGYGLGEYLRRVRVHAACDLMLRGDQPLSAVAASAGFSDESHMGRSFRGVMGCTPSEYRRRRVPRRVSGRRHRSG